MGLDAETVSKKDIDALFDTFDPDRSGSVDYHELNKALRRRVELDPSLRAGAAGAIELTSKNKSNRKPATGGGWGRARTKMRAASALKGAKYRSADAYLGELRLGHIEDKHDGLDESGETSRS